MTDLLDITGLSLRISELMELITMNCWSTFKTLVVFCQLSRNRSFQNYLKPGRRYAFRQLSELITVTFGAIRK